MFKVETYEDPIRYFNNLNINRDEIHILGQHSISTYLKEINQNKMINIWTYDDLMEALYPNWNSPINELWMEMDLYKILTEYDDRNIIKSMKKDIKSLLYAYRYLIEIGIEHIDERKAEDLPESIFIDVFNKFSKEPIVTESSIELKAVNSKDKIISRLNRRGIEKYKFRKNLLTNITKIYVHNMERLDMRRIIFFERMNWIKLFVTFRIPYYEGYNSLNRGWIEIYKEICDFNRWIKIDKPIIQTGKGKAYINYLEGKDILAEDRSNLTFLKFEESIEFKRYLKENPLQLKEVEYFAFSDDELNRYVRDEIKIANKRNNGGNREAQHIFDFGIGKFLYFLYEIEIKDGEIYIDYNSFLECITSGWIKNGEKALAFLKDIEPYMFGVETISDIIHRLESLEYLNKVSNIFDDNAKESTGENRIKKYLSNPFRVFPYVNLDRYSVSIEDLFQMAKEFQQMVLHIFEGNEELFDLKDHLRKLGEYWDQIEYGIIKNLDKEVYDKINNIFKQNLESHQVTKYGIRDFLILKLGIKGDEENIEVINSFQQLEGHILNGTKRLIIADLSSKSVNKYLKANKAIPNYLTYENIEKYIKNKKEKYNYILERSIKVSKRYDEYIQYFINYGIFQLLSFYNGEIEFCWIEDLNEFDDEFNTLKVIKNIYDLREGKVYFGDLESTTGDIFSKILNEDKPRENIFNKKKIYMEISPVGWRDLDFCPKKFLYSNVLKPNPIYYSDFHQRLAFSSIVTLFSDQAMGMDNVEKYLFPLFPQWLDTTKNNMLNTSFKRDLRISSKHQNIIFPKNLADIQILRSRYLVTKKWKIKNAYKKSSINPEELFEESLEKIKKERAEKGLHCSMCPHVLICLKGEFAIDRNRRY
jgi:hypothetical protein